MTCELKLTLRLSKPTTAAEIKAQAECENFSPPVASHQWHRMHKQKGEQTGSPALPMPGAKPRPGEILRQHLEGVAYCPASVATSLQFGSRVPRSRAKVHTSVTSPTVSSLPSTTLPLLSRVTEISWDTKRTVSWA